MYHERKKREKKKVVFRLKMFYIWFRKHKWTVWIFFERKKSVNSEIIPYISTRIPSDNLRAGVHKYFSCSSRG